MERLSSKPKGLLPCLKRMGWRRLNLLALFFAIMLLCASFYWQFVLGAQPCALCILQRLGLMGVALGCFIAAIKRLKSVGGRVLIVSQLFFAGVGAWGAARQWWLQYHPKLEGGICMPHFSSIMNKLSFTETLHTLLVGTSGCSELSLTILGLSPAFWLFWVFVMYMVFAGVTWLNVIE